MTDIIGLTSSNFISRLVRDLMEEHPTVLHYAQTCIILDAMEFVTSEDGKVTLQIWERRWVLYLIDGNKHVFVHCMKWDHSKPNHSNEEDVGEARGEIVDIEDFIGLGIPELIEDRLEQNLDDRWFVHG